MILITGSAGFIGFHTSISFLKNKHKVIGIDNINNYYNTKLKKDRITILKNYNNFNFEKVNITDKSALMNIFNKYKIKCVVHLAAQAGVRYSFENPDSYFYNNLDGFRNILDLIKEKKIKLLLYASSSSVYGSISTKQKFKETLKTDSPLSLYAFTKKSNEVLAHYYSNTFRFKAIGMRFFTAYGPYGRPDMSLFKFVDSITKNKKIEVFNNGQHSRDFTYIDDLTKFLYLLYKNNKKQNSNHEIYNLANGESRKLMDFIKIIEKELDKKAKIIFRPMQRGDVKETMANNQKVIKFTGYKPVTKIEDGINNFIKWYKKYY
tara:strand:+ start:332 stop:1291 length:960 start_codon:yes stop_codon:yes gene_type:complete